MVGGQEDTPTPSLPARGREERRHRSRPPSPLAGEGPAGDEGGAATTEPPNASSATELRRRRLQSFSRQLRQESTEAEKKLWRLLRDRRFAGHKFRRQVPIEAYIADFVSFDRRLIIELDGSQHAESVRDHERDAVLNRLGFHILRVWNSELNDNPTGVMEAIWGAMHPDAPPSSGPSDHLLPQGEKGRTVPGTMPTRDVQ